jgi:branched-chain amino acid aminotransferase
MKELEEASLEGRLIEAFGAGTAAIVSPIRTISWRGKELSCGLSENEESGEIAMKMKEWMEAIQYGDEPHEWSYIIE